MTMFEINYVQRSVTYRGIKLKLTPYEYKILSLLVEHPGRIYSRAQLLKAVWGDAQTNSERLVDSRITTLRAKLSAVHARGEESIQTHQGLGYAMRSMPL